MHWHWQNLNEDRNGKVKGSGLRKGRAWFHFTRKTIHVEWYFLDNLSTALTFERDKFGDPAGYSFHIAIWKLFALFFSLEGIRWPYTDLNDSRRVVGFRIFDGSIWWDLWSDNLGYGPQRTAVWHVRDWVLGRAKYSRQVISEGDTSISMPEGNYPVHYQECLDTWKRPRWKARTIRRFDMDMGEDGIPIPGKGENSWDMDDTAILSGTYVADNLLSALHKLRASANRDRERYGGKNWTPAE